jgi:hypothetical protein
LEERVVPAPAFAVFGSVSNQAHDAEAGWSVFLDYNNDGKHESNEPIEQTSNPDGAYAFTPTFDSKTGWDPVPVGKAFNVVLVVPAPQNFAAVAPATVTYDGQNTELVPFMLQERSAIKGTVFEDANGTGPKKGATPIAGATVYLDLNHSGVRDPGDPTAITDAAGHYEFANLAPGTYTVALDPFAGSKPVAAYVVAAGTVGNDTDYLTEGMDFSVNEPILVTSLGLFDSGGTGWDVEPSIGNAFSAYYSTLYNTKTGTQLATMRFYTSDPGTLIGGTRFKQLAEPLLLPAGFQGTVAKSPPFLGGGNKPFGFIGATPLPPQPWTTNGSQGAVSFVGHGRIGFDSGFPDQPASDGPANPYAAASFLYSVPALVVTSPSSPGTYTVTIDSSGFDLSERNDFGAKRPARTASFSSLQADHSLLGSAGGGTQTLSPAGTILAVSRETDGFGSAVDFAITADHNLWEHDANQAGAAPFKSDGWALISTGNFQSISAATNAAGAAVVFGVLADGSLWEYNPAFGNPGSWQMLSPAGTVLSVSAVTEPGGEVAFAVTADHNLWEHNAAKAGAAPFKSDGWAFISPGEFQSVSAATNAAGSAVAFGVLADNSLWEFNPAFPNPGHWQLLSPAGTVLAVSGVSGAGGEVAFAVTADHNLWEHNAGLAGAAPFKADGWALLSTGTFQSVTATEADGEQPAVFGVLADGSLWEFTTQWQQLSSGGVLAVTAG